MRILLLAPNRRWKYNWGTHLFREELIRQHDVAVYGPGWNGVDRHNTKGLTTVHEIMSFFEFHNPDVIVTCGVGVSGYIGGLQSIKNIPKVALICDYFPRNYKQQDNFLTSNHFDAAFVPYLHSMRRLRKLKPVPRTYWLPHGVDLGVYRNKKLRRRTDVCFICSYNSREYPNRPIVRNNIASLKNLKRHLKKVKHGDYIEVLNRSKIAVASSDRYKSFNLRMTEIPACGSMLLSDPFEGMVKLGYKPDENFILYETVQQMKNKIQYFIDRPNELEVVAKKGERLVRRRHSNVVRVEKFASIVKDCFKIKED